MPTHLRLKARRIAVAVTLSLAIAGPSTVALAATGESDSPATGEAASNASTAATQPSNSTAESKAGPAVKGETSSAELENELQEVRELLRSQQQRMEMLEEELRAAKGTAEPAEPEATSIGPVAGALTTGDSSAENPQEPLAISFKGVTLTPGGYFAGETVWYQRALGADVNTPFNSAPLPGASQTKMSEFHGSGRSSRINMLVEGRLSTVKLSGFYEMDFLGVGTTSNNNQSNSYTPRQRQFWAQAAFDNGWAVTAGQMYSLVTGFSAGMNNRSEATPVTIDAQQHVGWSWARQFGFRVTKDFNNKIWLGFSVENSQATLTVHGNPTATCAPANPNVAGSVATCSASALNGTLVTVPAAGGTTSTAVVGATTFNNFLLGSFGTSSGLYNPLGNYQFNPSPDFVVKAVFEPGFGHYEIFGIETQFRARVFPCVTDKALAGCGGLATSAANSYNSSVFGGGFGMYSRWDAFSKHVTVGLHYMQGNGLGRYGSGQLSDVTTRYSIANPLLDGSLAMIMSYQALGSLELHPVPKLDVYLYTGGEYANRTQFAKAAGAAPNEGYGATGFANYGCQTEILPFAGQSTSASTGIPNQVAGINGFIPGVLQNCTGDTRNLIEGTIGFWYRFYEGSKGRFQFGGQYTNFVRNTWRGVGTGTVNGITYITNGGPHSDENEVFTSLRYYLP
jgi:hypothetical protein